MHTYTSPPRSARKARELLTTSGGAPKPEPELRRPRGINCIHVDRGGTRCKSTSASRSSWSSPRGVICVGPTHRTDADSDSREYIATFRQPIRRFTVSRPPRSACRFTCVSALYWLCVSSFPVGFSEDRSFGVVSRAKRSE